MLCQRKDSILGMLTWFLINLESFGISNKDRWQYFSIKHNG